MSNGIILWAAKNVMAEDREWVVTVFEDGSALIERQESIGDGFVFPEEVARLLVREYDELKATAG